MKDLPSIYSEELPVVIPRGDAFDKTVYDLCFAWEWVYDTDFACLLESASARQDISLLQVVPANLPLVLESLDRKEIDFHILLDRASDSDNQFIGLIQHANKLNKFSINRYRLARRAWNKVYCHECFTNAGLPTPQTTIIPSYTEQPDLQPVNMALLGSAFYIKPAHGGGGKGVIIRASSWEQVLVARQEFPADQYLLQASVTPAQLDGRQAWFRVLYCTGEIFPCWWDTQTHVYTPLILSERSLVIYQYLQEIMAKIASICKLELFSTEIAYTNDGNCVIIDYLNDPIDLRVQSKAADGVPDEIVNSISDRIVSMVASKIRE